MKPKLYKKVRYFQRNNKKKYDGNGPSQVLLQGQLIPADVVKRINSQFPKSGIRFEEVRGKKKETDTEKQKETDTEKQKETDTEKK